MLPTALRAAIAVFTTAGTFASFMYLASLAGSPWSSEAARNGYIAILLVVVASAVGYAVHGMWFADLRDELWPWSQGSTFRTRASWIISVVSLSAYYLALLGGLGLIVYGHVSTPTTQ